LEERQSELNINLPMKHSFPCVESMRRVNLSNGRVVRVWRDRTKDLLAASYDDADIVSTCIAQATNDTQLLAALGKLKGVNAVELVDANGQGTVIYTSWP
jgi:hypothetical protein